MKYLMYYTKGFVKKFPLNDPTFTIGRSSKCDLVVDDELFSRQHVRGEFDGQVLTITDLDSTNGTFLGTERIGTARVEANQSFSVGTVRFYLKEGDLEEFAPSPELIPLFNELAREVPRSLPSQETRYIRDIYREILKMLLSEGLARGDWSWFLKQLSYHLGNLSEVGDMALVRKGEGEAAILLSVYKTVDADALVSAFVADFDRSLRLGADGRRLPGSERVLYSFPLNLMGSQGALLYLPLPGRAEESERIIGFVTHLAKEIELLVGMEVKAVRLPPPARDPVSASALDIVASSGVMKGLIGQAIKIADSDIFVLIHGESGTGKELFARLIHEHSPRRAGHFVALNCAAIPETLLEAELFGSERGAFTGAFARKKGKLELASGGTLVLDEIGDMPMTVQTKLLRALQEHEFYRLGGDEPIRVDLRIISLTHRDLKQLILAESFRADLYYRLVHHTIHVPPLRERQEDIASLINHFTHKFCSKIGRNINGYSVQAHHFLMKYAWPGNVRQLENEVKRVVNLADEGDMIGLDMLSEEIVTSGVAPAPGVGTARPVFASPTEELMAVLQACNWSQSEAARQLNMTYQGLHKRIKRLGLEKTVREKRTGGAA
jgi:DNA-binding NtrC family response regulator